jgi:hypothetical protein
MREIRKVAKRHNDQIDCLDLRDVDLLIEITHIEIFSRAIRAVADVADGYKIVVELGRRERGHVGLPLAIVAWQDGFAASGQEQRQSQNDAQRSAHRNPNARRWPHVGKYPARCE